MKKMKQPCTFQPTHLQCSGQYQDHEPSDIQLKIQADQKKWILVAACHQPCYVLHEATLVPPVELLQARDPTLLSHGWDWAEPITPLEHQPSTAH